MTAQTYPVFTGYAYSADGSYTPPIFTPTTDGYNGGSPEYIVDNNPSATQINYGDQVTVFDDNYGQSTNTYLGYALEGTTQQPFLYNGSYYLFGATAGQSYTIINGPDTQVACYCVGTLIRTVRGEVAVEHLRVGDLAITASGVVRPIVWLGHRKIDTTRRPNPAAVWPVVVRAEAFGAGLPRRDLWLSPGHNLEIEGRLMPVRTLVNGVSVQQIRSAQVEYWHIELDAHDILIAEGVPAESYLDTGNRTAFVHGGAYIEAHPDFAPRYWADTCLPLVLEGPAIAATKQRLLARLTEQGHRIDQDADAHIVVDEMRFEPIRLDETRLAFVLPAGGRDIELRSNLFVPAHTIARSADVRELGLCVGRLQIDGAAVAIGDDANCQEGWHEAEFAEGFCAHRWTRGATPIRAGARLVIVDVAGVGSYWRTSGTALRSDMPATPVA